MTLFTSDKKKAAGAALGYVAISLFTALVGAIYECFSHEVYSYYMIYAFVIPLLLGALPALWIAVRDGMEMPDGISRFCWRSGIAILTTGSLMQGVLEIYGTTNRLMIVYPVMAIPLLLTGAVSYGKGALLQ